MYSSIQIYVLMWIGVCVSLSCSC